VPVTQWGNVPSFWRKAAAEVAAEEVAADAGDEQTGGEARHGNVGPGHEVEPLGFEVGPAREVAAYEPAVDDQAAAPEGEEIGQGVELVDVRDDVQQPRPDDRRHRRHDVAVGHLLLRQPVAIGQAERQVPADDERAAEHDAVRVDGQGLLLERRVAIHHGGPDGRDRREHPEGGGPLLLGARGDASVADQDQGREGQPPPEHERPVRERDVEQDRVHAEVVLHKRGASCTP
jgi:hypothetical protein